MIYFVYHIFSATQALTDLHQWETNNILLPTVLNTVKSIRSELLQNIVQLDIYSEELEYMSKSSTYGLWLIHSYFLF